MSNPWTEVYKDIREPFLQEKMAKKDYDGDGKVETGTQEYMGSRDKAIKKAMGKDNKMKKESMHSSNPAQQAAIAIAKKKKKEDDMVAKKKKMEEEKYDNRYSDNTGEESKKKKAALEKKRGMKLDNHPQFKREEKEPPRMQKGAMAYDGPNKERSLAADRVLAKTKKKMAKEDAEDISELSKETLGGYVKKASKETRGNMMATQHGSGIPKKAKDIKLKQVNKRLKGMEKAGEKMAKEDVEPVIEEMEPFGLFMDMFVEQQLEEEVMDDILEIIYEKCWKGYEKKGMKTMFGKRYPNCVKKEEVEDIDESSMSAGSSGGNYSDGGDGVFRSKQQVANMFNKNIPTKKQTGGKVNKMTRKSINTSAKDFGIQGPSTTKESLENTYQNYMKGLQSKVYKK